MSNDEITRHRRIISLMSPAQTADRVIGATATGLPPTRRLERFQRTLLSPMLAQPIYPTRLVEERPQNEAAPASAPSQNQVKSGGFKVGAENEGGLENDTHTDVMARNALVEEKSDQHEHGHPTRPVDTMTAPAPAVPAWVKDLADLVSQTCSHADKAFSQWSVVIPLDPAVLPDTTLRLDLSPSRLLLRFCTQSTHSQSVISYNIKYLIALLQGSTSPIQNIEVDIT